jgi:phage N-6-adenine-methyltransferase
MHGAQELFFGFDADVAAGGELEVTDDDGASSRAYMPQSGSHQWGTPPEIVRVLADRWAGGAFDLDVAASDDLHVCPAYYTEADDGLSLEWHGRCWMNPPYGAAHELAWVSKAVKEVLEGRAEVVVCLLPAKVGSVWWHRFVAAAGRGDPGTMRLRYPTSAVEFPAGRISFMSSDGRITANAPFPSAVVVFEDWLKAVNDPVEEAETMPLFSEI